MNLINIQGKILIDPINLTNKHNKQSSWKKMGLILFKDDLSNYYNWFIKKRYNINLNKPLRGPHISFINDSYQDFLKYKKFNTEEEININWNKIKQKYDNQTINVILNTDVRSDGKYWWLNIPEEYRSNLHSIRNEFGLGRPYFGLHMSIGYTNDKNIEHSKYILKLINKYKNEYN
jgi:hypothetical protein